MQRQKVSSTATYLKVRALVDLFALKEVLEVAEVGTDCLGGCGGAVEDLKGTSQEWKGLWCQTKCLIKSALLCT